MKLSAPRSIKFMKLKRRLGIPHWQCVGLLESLWLFTQTNAPAGDIGKHTDEDIAAAIEWDGDASELVKNLIECGWLDECGTNRLVVHDWQDHAPTYLKGAMSKNEIPFAKTKSAKQGAKQRAKQGAKQDSKQGAKQGGRQPAPYQALPYLSSPSLSSEELPAVAGPVEATGEDRPEPANEGEDRRPQPVRNPHQQAVAAFCEKWQAKYGVKYPFAGGKHGDAVKWMLGQCDGDAEKLAGIFDRFLSDSDKFYATESRHDLSTLRQHFTRWLVSGTPPPPTPLPKYIHDVPDLSKPNTLPPLYPIKPTVKA